MNITIDTEKLWDFVRDAYEEGKEDGYKETLKAPRFWQASEAKKQVEEFLAVPDIDWVKARAELSD